MTSSGPARAPVYVTVDLVVLTVRDERLHVLLVERGFAPYQGKTVLPGGFLGLDEDLEEAARRELAEETSIEDAQLHLEQLRSYGAPNRDPRGRVVTVAYLAIAPNLPRPVAASDARKAWWHPVEPALATPDSLAFDHNKILADAVERAREKLEYTTLATAFCGDVFTIDELRGVYEAVWGVPLDAPSFNQRIASTTDFVVPTGEQAARGNGAPAALYRKGQASVLYPPMFRAAAASEHI